jgi:uncharacterized protein (TIGR03000 family)
MYTMVLMMAMSGSADVVAFGRGGCNGCTGGGYGSCTGYAGCCGGGGCRGGYGCRGGGCHGCRGGGYGCRGSGCCGGGYGCAGGCTGGPAGPMAPRAEPVPPPKPGMALLPAPATLVVTLPEGAQLSINDVPTTSADAQRTFVSPPLERGKSYYYNLRAEVVRDGQKTVSTRQVIVRAGQESRVQFEMPMTATGGQ